DQQLVQQRPADEQGHAGGQGEEDHQHAQAAARLDDADLHVVEPVDVALGQRGQAQRLHDEGASYRGQPLQGGGQGNLGAAGQGEQEGENPRRRPGLAETRGAAALSPQLKYGGEQGDDSNRGEVLVRAAEPQDDAQGQKGDAPPPRTDGGPIEPVAAQPEQQS